MKYIAGMMGCLLLVACGKQPSSLNERPVEVSATPAFRLPEIPVMLQDPEERLEFMVQHYWMHFDFTDTACVHVPEVTEQALVDYLDLLSNLSLERAEKSLAQTLHAAWQTEQVGTYMSETLRRYLWDPNSPLRNEVLYESVARLLVAAPEADEAVRSRARHDLKLLSLNRPGTKAADFRYTLASGQQGRMHAIRSPYLLLLFYDPDCAECAQMIHALQTSPVIRQACQDGQLTLLAFYPDEDLAAWHRHQAEMPATWIRAYDKEQSVLTNERYDLKAMPTLYLLDKDKTVVFKDADLIDIEEYFEK